MHSRVEISGLKRLTSPQAEVAAGDLNRVFGGDRLRVAGVFLADMGNLIESRTSNRVRTERPQSGCAHTEGVNMGWQKKVSQYGRHIMHFRQSAAIRHRFRVMARETEYTMSDLLRACISALLSTEDRNRILRILKRHLPEAACLAWAVG